jgi:hypothetical protein
MKRSSFRQRLQAATAAIAAISVMALPFGQASAADDEESPFGDAVRMADASLDKMRGGFDPGGGGLLRFAVNVTTAVNGTPIASLSIDNLKGSFESSSTNLGRTVSINNQGNVQIQTTTPAPTAPVTGAPPTLTNNASVVLGSAPPASTPQGSGPVTVTTTLVPAASAVVTASGTNVNSSSSSSVLSRSSSPAFTSNTGALLATTELLPDGHGLLTVVQNVNSKLSINLVQTLNIQLSGVGNTLLRNGGTTRAFANSMSLSLHH